MQTHIALLVTTISINSQQTTLVGFWITIELTGILIICFCILYQTFVMRYFLIHPFLLDLKSHQKHSCTSFYSLLPKILRNCLFSSRETYSPPQLLTCAFCTLTQVVSQLSIARRIWVLGLPKENSAFVYGTGRVLSALHS